MRGKASTARCATCRSPRRPGASAGGQILGAAAFCIVGTLTVVVVWAPLVGLVLFPVGPVTLLSGAQVTVGEGLVRLLAESRRMSRIWLLGLTAIGLFFSTLTTVPIGAMAATALLAVTAQIVGAIPQLEAVHPWLFTDRWLDFADLLRAPIVWDSFVGNAMLQAAYIVEMAAAIARFVARDVLSSRCTRAAAGGACTACRRPRPA